MCQQGTATHCNTLQHTATHCNTLQHNGLEDSDAVSEDERGNVPTTHCNTLQHTRIQTRYLRMSAEMCQQHTATHCNTLQHTATHCNTLQLTANHCKSLQLTATLDSDTASEADTSSEERQQRTATATHCNLLEHTATHCKTGVGRGV